MYLHDIQFCIGDNGAKNNNIPINISFNDSKEEEEEEKNKTCSLFVCVSFQCAPMYSTRSFWLVELFYFRWLKKAVRDTISSFLIGLPGIIIKALYVDRWTTAIHTHTERKRETAAIHVTKYKWQWQYQMYNMCRMQSKWPEQWYITGQTTWITAYLVVFCFSIRNWNASETSHSQHILIMHA